MSESEESVKYKYFFDKLEKDGILRDELASLGWGFWTFDQEGKCQGYMDEHILRVLANEIERRNKPFWDAYEEHCKNLPPVDMSGFTEPSPL